MKIDLEELKWEGVASFIINSHYCEFSIWSVVISVPVNVFRDVVL
jgi:hypothetical protein